VTSQKGVEDLLKGLVVGERDRNEPEMSLISRVHEEGSSRGVHRSEMLAFNDFFDGKLGDVVPMLVICVLSQKSDGSLGVVGIQLGHVEVINVVNHVQFGEGSELSTGLLFEGGFKHILEIAGVGVVIEINNGVSVIFRVFGNKTLQDTVSELGFTGSGVSNQKASVLHKDQIVNEF
jgi:hypothetical protein